MFKKLLNLIAFPFRFLLRLPNYILPHRLMRRLSPRKRKAVNLTLITFLLVVGGYFLWTLITPNSSDAAWWNDSWMYRQLVTITNSNGSDLTDFQVLVEVDTESLIDDGKMKNDCSDVRFTDEGGNLLPYWIETGANACDTSATNIWVKVPTVFTSGTLTYLYYGNSGAQAVQDGNMVFEFFDDFSGSTIDDSKWTIGTVGATSGTEFAVSEGVLTGGNNNRFVRSQAVYTGDYTAEARTYTTTDNVNGFTTVGFFASTSDSFGILDHNNTSYYRNDSSWVNFSFDGTGQWSKSTTKVVGTSATYARVGETSGSSTATATNSGLSSEYIRIGARYDNATPNQDFVASWDWITVRKAAATDPSASLGSEEKSEGPVLYFAFDEGTGTTTKDGSASRFTGTLVNSPAWTPPSQCIVGSCLHFDGSDTDNNQTVIYTETSTSPTNITGDVTISAWIKPTSNYLDTSQGIVRNGSGANLVYSMFYDPTNKRPYFHWYDGQFKQVTGTSNTVPLDEWSYVTVVRESNVVSFYVNGKFTNSEEVTTPTVLSNQMSIGRTNSGSAQDYTGYLDELKIYPYARSAGQILQDFNTRGGNASGAVLGATDFESLSQGLVGYWKMDETSWTGNCSTATVMDSSGNSNNGIACPNGDAPAASPSGKFGGSGYFDGANDYVNVPGSTSLNALSNFTVAFWASASASTQPYSMLATKFTSDSLATFQIMRDGSNNRLQYRTSNGSTTYTQIGSTNIFNSTWHHVVYTYDGSRIRAYVDGVKDVDQALTMATYTANNAVTIGSRGGAGGYYLQGMMDELRIYNRELSPQEVSNLYNFAPGPVAYYNMEEGGGSVLKDVSTYGNNGSFTGGSPDWVLGKYGKGVSFRNNNYASLGSPLNGNASWTYSAWIYPTAASVSVCDGIIGQGNNPRVTWGTCGGSNTRIGVLAAWSESPGYKSIISDPLAINKWHYITAVFDTTNPTDQTLKLYINGSLVVSESATTGTITRPSIGHFINRRDSASSFPGTIDEVRIYNYARTPAQIAQDMNASHPIGGSPVGSQVGYWKFNEGYGTSFGNSGYAGDALNGTFDSTAAWSDDGKFSRALKTDGSATGDAAVPDSDSIDFAYNQDFTVSFWMKNAETNNDRAIVEKWSSSGGYPYVFRLHTNSIRFARYDGSNNPQITGKKIVNDGKWHYVLGTKNGSTLALYIDGKLQSTITDTTSGTTTNTSPLYLGSRGGGSTLWSGYIDELKIYNTGFNQFQVNLDMNQGSSQVMGAFGLNPDGTASNSASQTYCVPGDFTTSSCKPTAQWSFEENQGRTANDTSGNGYTAAFNGNPAWTIGRIGSGLSFNNSSDYLSTNAPTGSNWSISVWSKFPLAVTGNYRTLVRQGSGIHHILVDSSGLLGVYNSSFASSGFDVDTLSSGWHHIAALGSGGSTVFYVDGQQVGTSAQQVTSNVTQIGGIGSQNWGTMDELRIYNYVLSSAQIAWDYNRGKPVGHWKLDECQGSTVNDSSGFGNRGTITIGGSGSQTSVGTCQTASTAWGNGVNGKFNYSLNFDGTDDYVTATSGLYNLTNNFTLSAWVHPVPDSNVNYSILASSAWSSTDRDWWFHRRRSGLSNQLSFWAINGSQISSTKAVPASVWSHTVFTLNNGIARLYINGALAAEDVSFGAITTGNTGIHIGRRGDNQQFMDGQIDDVQIFNYPLTDVQIRNLYNQSSAVRFGPSQGAP